MTNLLAPFVLGFTGDTILPIDGPMEGDSVTAITDSVAANSVNWTHHTRPRVQED